MPVPSPLPFVADDLSGALEVAASLRAAGLAVTLPMDGQGAPLSVSPWPADAIVLNTDTRRVDAAQAAAAIHQTLARLDPAADAPAYFKMDSTLRGPFAAQLAQMLSDRPERRFVVAPANPPAGRTVREGLLYVDGVPVADSAAGLDPLEPVRSSRIDRPLVLAGLSPIAQLGLDATAGGSAPCVRAIRQAFDAGNLAVVMDAVSPRDLAVIAQACDQLGPDVLPVGSGGLAGALGHVLAGRHEAPAPRRGHRPDGGGALFVVGSAHEKNRRQVDRLVAETSCEVIGVSAAGLIRGPEPTDALVALATRVASAVERTGLAVCVLDAVDPHWSPAVASAQACRALGALAQMVDWLNRLGGLFVTGGQTAQAVFEALDAQWLRLESQLEPGCAGAEAVTPHGRIWTVTKPGGFGQTDTMFRAWQWLSGQTITQEATP